MVLALRITKQAIKEMEALPPKQFRQIGIRLLDLLANPEPQDSSPLRGASRGERRIDVGEYRVVYVHDADTVSVMVVGKRNGDEVYRLWERVAKAPSRP